MAFDWDLLEIDNLLMITEDVIPDLAEFLVPPGEKQSFLVYPPPSPAPRPDLKASLAAVRVRTYGGSDRSLWQATMSDGRLARRIPWRWAGRCSSSQGRPCGR